MPSDPSGPPKRNIYDQWVLDTFGVDPSTYPPLRAAEADGSALASLAPATGLPGSAKVVGSRAPLPRPVTEAAGRRRDNASDAQPPPDISGSDHGDGGSPGLVASAFRHVFGHVDPDAWGVKGAAAGGLGGAFVGGVAGGAGEGTLGALAGTVVEPGGGTFVGGVAGATDGATRGAVLGGMAGAAVLGTAAKLTGVVINTMEGGDGKDSPGEQSRQQPQASSGGSQADPPSTRPAEPSPEVSSQDIEAFRSRIGVPETDTVGVARTNIPGLNGKAFEGASPQPRYEGGLPSTTQGPISSPATFPTARNHAEEDIANQFVAAVEEARLEPASMDGKELVMRIQNETGVCSICRQGLRNPNVPPGVLMQLSQRYPTLRIHVVVDNPGPKLTGPADFVLLNGAYVK